MSDALRRWRWPLTVAAALLMVALISLLAEPRASRIPLAPDNPRPAGARAAAEILERQGVEIAVRRTTAAALGATPADGTLFITEPALLDTEQWAAIAEARVDLVLTDVAYADLTGITSSVEPTGLGSDGIRRAVCEDPDAAAAGTLATGSGDVRATAPDVVVCFPDSAMGGSAVGGSEVGAYAVATEDGRRIAILANSRPITNAALADAGNAALVLRMLGRTEHLTWYIPSVGDTARPAASVLPPATTALALWAIVVALVTMVWRGRRLGRVVVEPLPVVVRPGETTLGRARLYRRARAHAHAAAALRAASASRLATRLGVPASGSSVELLAALGRATGRPGPELTSLLFGPPPADDAAMLALARALDSLEAEVYRP